MVYHPTTRLLSLLELLQTRGTMRRADLGARLLRAAALSEGGGRAPRSEHGLG